MSIKIEGFPPSLTGATGGLVYKGELDPSSPPANITSAQKGDFYVVNADGTLATVDLNTGDHIVFNENASSPLIASMFDKIDNTEPSASTTVAGNIQIATNTEASNASVNNKALVPSNIASIKTSVLDNDAGFITSALQSGDNVSELTNDAGYLTSGIQSGDNVSLLTNNAGYLTSVPSASTTVAGAIEIATNTEASNASELNKALVPSNIASIKTSVLNNDAGFITSALQSGDNVSELTNDAGYLTSGIQSGDNVSLLTNNAGYLTSVPSASTTVAGAIEIATNTEASNASELNKALVPSNIASIKTSVLNNDAGFITSALQSGDNVSELTNDAGYLTSGIQSGDNVSLLTNNAGYLTSVPSASTTVAGAIEIATNTEASNASELNKALVPSNIASIKTSVLNNDAGFITSGIQSGDNVSLLTNDAGYITSGIQSGDNVSLLTNDAGYLTSYTETDTLDNVVSRGASTTTTMNTGSLLPLTAGTYFLGSSSKEWHSLYLKDSGTIYWGDDNDTRLIHDPDEGLILKMSTSEQGNTKPKFTLEAGGTTQGSELVQVNLRASPVANDVIGYLIGNARQSGNSFTDYTQIESVIIDPTSTEQQGAIVVKVKAGESNTMKEGLKVFSDDNTTVNPKVRISNAFTLPSTSGSANQVLQSDGNGNVTWEDQSGGGGATAPTVTTDSSSTDTTISTSTGIEEIHLISNGSTAVTITIPTASTVGSGYKYNIKRLGSANVTLQSQSISSGNNQIDGANSHILTSSNESVTLVSNGTTFFII